MHVIPFPAQGVTPWTRPELMADVDMADASKLRELLFASYSECSELRCKLAEAESKRRAAESTCEESRAAWRAMERDVTALRAELANALRIVQREGV